ncbi:YqgE/AlgH family protein [Daejeonella oryzae]|uniref:YqgE/AlgH family protein n=1 Tax=Daejeonella oryzae TaxID=1122943 RepID=UPI00047E1E7D|nr:YqgE/AlgH family protein [Daejeonella oryzae]
MLNSNKHQAGSLLISEPFMIDPNFKRSVVLLVEKSEGGDIGFVLNQRSDLLVSDLIPDCWNATFPVFVGGPVGKDTLHFIHRCYDKISSGIEISEGLYWGGDFEGLKMLINSNQIRSDEVKFFVGYSGWGEDQLKSEIEQNSWLIENNYKPDVLFVEDEENLWKEVVISLGPKYAHIVNFPENPSWN